MAVITVRLDDEIKSRLEDLAFARQVSVSSLLKLWIDEHIYPESRDNEIVQPRMTPLSINTLMRKQLALSHRILARLVNENIEDGDKEYQLNLSRILEKGYTLEYDNEFSDIEPELTRDDCLFVMNIFDMFRHVLYSIQSLKENGKTIDAGLAYKIEFVGFDFNISHEAALADFGRYLIDNNRWIELKAFYKKHDNGNSHAPMKQTYNRMLTQWNIIRDSKRHCSMLEPLTIDELQLIADASMGISPQHN